jgi:hypothetical protein
VIEELVVAVDDKPINHEILVPHYVACLFPSFISPRQIIIIIITKSKDRDSSQYTCWLWIKNFLFLPSSRLPLEPTQPQNASGSFPWE